jgi:hypothetical protein
MFFSSSKARSYQASTGEDWLSGLRGRGFPHDVIPLRTGPRGPHDCMAKRVMGAAYLILFYEESHRRGFRAGVSRGKLNPTQPLPAIMVLPYES